MNRLVIVRVGDPEEWNRYRSLGRWSSPENHTQVVRNFFVEGYNVITLFVGRGDIPLAAARVTNVRERLMEDSVFPTRSDLGDLRTFFEFDPQTILNLENGFTVTHHTSLQQSRYQIGSQIAIHPNTAREFLNYFLVMTSVNTPYRGNVTFLVPDNLHNPVNFII